jgi:hypothetical protein
VQVQGTTDRRLPVWQSARAEADAVGLDQARNEKLYVAQPGLGRADRVHRMDAGWSPEAFEFVGLREDKDAMQVGRED